MIQNIVLILAICSSATSTALTLEEAEQSAAQNSHELKALAIETESAHWSDVKASSAFMPKLDLVGRHLFKEKFEELEIQFGGGNFIIPAIQPYTNLSLEAKFNIFDGFASTHMWRAAKLSESAAEQRLEGAKNKTRAETRTLFYRALGTQVLADVAAQNVKTLQEHLNDVEARLRSGVSTRFDALRIEVQLEEAKTEVISASDQITIARAKLFQALGITDDGLPLQGTLPESWNQIAIEKINLDDVKRSDREAQKLMVEEQRQRSLAAQAHWMPKVSLFGSKEWYNNYNHAITQSDERFKNAYSYGVLLTWNLFDGGASLAGQQIAALADREKQEHLAQLDQKIPVELDEAKRRLAYDISTYKARLSSIRKAEESVRLARSGLQAGVRTNTEVLDAMVDLNRAKASAVKTQMDAVEALGALEIALGHPLTI